MGVRGLKGLSGLRAVFGGVTYLLRDEFITALGAGSVNGTAAEPGPGTRTVVDTGNALSMLLGSLSFSAGGPGAWGNPNIVYGDIPFSRLAGRMVKLECTPSIFNIGGYPIGWAVSQNPTTNFEPGIRFRAPANGFEYYDGATIVFDLAPLVFSTSYQIILVLRDSGGAFFIKGGIYTDWTLQWLGAVGATATLYVGASNYRNTWTSEYARVPYDLWLPEPVASDGFNAANGTSLDAHPTDGLGHPEGVAGGLGSGGAGLVWTEQNGDWEIQGNKAWGVGADPGEWTATLDSGDSDVIVTSTINITNANASLVLRYTSGTAKWVARADAGGNSLSLYEVDAGWTQRVSRGVAINLATDYELRAIAYGQTIDVYLDGKNKISYTSAAFNETETVHGIESSSVNELFDDFTVYPRGTDGEYSRLDAY